jgi:uncharacterized protein
MNRTVLTLADLSIEPGQRLARMVAIQVAGVEVHLPVYLINGAGPGKTLVLTAGIHGAEYPCVEAALRLGQTLDPASLRGKVIIVPSANPVAFAARSIYVSPPDGKNLNRQFPGEAGGTFSQALAHWLFTHLIRQGDAYIDLHGGDMIEALVPFVMYQLTGQEELDAVSESMALSFGIRHVLRGQRTSGIGGATHVAAANAGVPAILAEAGGQGVWDEESVGILVQGVRRVMATLDMIESAERPGEAPVILPGWSWLRAEANGLFYPSVHIGDRVKAGQDLGRVADFFGVTLQSIQAPQDGIVLFLVTSLAMNAGDPLLAIAG